MQAALQAAGIKPHGFSLATARDVEALRSRKLLAPVQAVGTPCLVIQDASGRVLPAGRALPLPASEEDFLALLGLK